MTTFLSDPFDGDINPGSTNVQKLYTLATAEQKKDTLLYSAQEHATDIMASFCHDLNN